MRTFVGELELELQPRPLMVVGQFRLAAPEGEKAPLHLAPLALGAVLAAPAAFALFVSAARAQFGFLSPFDVIDRYALVSLVMRASLFLGAPIAVILSVLPIMRWSLSRAGGKIATSLVFKPTFVHLIVAGIALFVEAVFFGHLIADEFACIRGIAAAC